MCKHLVFSVLDSERLRKYLVETTAQGPREDQHVARRLSDELMEADVLPPERIPKDVVTLHSLVRVVELDSKNERVYELVLPEESEPAEGRVSVLAPMGAALLGSHAGDTIEWEAPRGRRQAVVAGLLYQPEAAGHFHL